MIRYVLAALLTVAIVGMAMVAIDASASDNAERELQTAISDIEDGAVDLVEHEELSPANHPNPQRVVEFSMPTRGLTSVGVDHFEIEPHDDANVSVARYVLADGTTGRELIDERIVYYNASDDRPTEIGGSGRQTLRLVLLPDENGNPVVVAEPPDEYDPT